MATVTIAKPYFEALLRRAEFHTSGHEFDTFPSLSSNVTISKAEHDYLLRAVREYNSLKNALFRGGLTVETLETLLTSDTGPVQEEPIAYQYPTSNNNDKVSKCTWEGKFARPKSSPVVVAVPRSSGASPDSDNTAVGEGFQYMIQPQSYSRVYSSEQLASSIDSPEKDDEFDEISHQGCVPVHDQRTVVIANLSDRTNHKDLTTIIRGGRLLDIFLRKDRTATVSFVEGADEFMAYAKRNDIYLHTKRLEVRWSDRQFHVPPHVSNKISYGATRNLVVRGAAGKLAADQIRDHLDHIHKLVVVDIRFDKGDAYISTNSIHNAMFARTCMMSRTAYKGLRIDWYPDECAESLPRPSLRVQTPAAPAKPMPITNRYTLLDIEGDDGDSESDEVSFTHRGLYDHNSNE